MKNNIKQMLPIENKAGQQAVNARHLYQWLGVKKDFSNWMKAQIARCDLVELVDYQAFAQKVECQNGVGYTMRTDYALSINAAKEISMMSQTEKGKEARRYFIECERIAKEIKPMLASYQIEDPIERAKKWIEEQEERKKLEHECQEQQLLIEQKDARLELQKKELIEAAPKVTFYDDVLQSTDTMTTTQVAKSIGMDANKLNRRLRDIGIQFRQSGMWMLRAPYCQWNLHGTRTQTFTHSDGTTGTSQYTVWSMRGYRLIHALNANGWNIRKAIKSINPDWPECQNKEGKEACAV